MSSINLASNPRLPGRGPGAAGEFREAHPSLPGCLNLASPTTPLAGLVPAAAQVDTMAAAGVPSVLHPIRRPACASELSGPAVFNLGMCGNTSLSAAGPTARTPEDYQRAKLAAKKELAARGRDIVPSSGSCLLSAIVAGSILAWGIISLACPLDPGHKTPTGERVVIEDTIAIVLEPTVIAEDMVLATPEQYLLRDFITDQTKAKYKSLSWEEAEFFANCCMRFDEPLKWCARGWAESSARRNVINDSGHRGFWQISSLHEARMIAQGLDITSEVDRTTFAKVLSASRGNKPWVQSESSRKRFQAGLEKRWRANK